MNKVFIRGNLTRDVELRETKSGKQVSRFNVAVRRDFKNSEGEYESDFINCVAYGTLAETIDKYFHKGSGIIVLGHLQTGSYEKDDGTKVYTTDLIVENIEFDRKPETKKEEPVKEYYTKVEDIEEKTDSEIIADAMKEDPYEKFGEQIEIDGFELPF